MCNVKRQPLALHRDPQVRGFLMTMLSCVGLIFISIQSVFRQALESNPCAKHCSTSLPSFRVQGFCVGRYMTGARFPLRCSFSPPDRRLRGVHGLFDQDLPIFQLLFASIRRPKLQRIRLAPRHSFTPRYDGRPISGRCHDFGHVFLYVLHADAGAGCRWR